jgi:hypothetical protein
LCFGYRAPWIVAEPEWPQRTRAGATLDDRLSDIAAWHLIDLAAHANGTFEPDGAAERDALPELLDVLDRAAAIGRLSFRIAAVVDRLIIIVIPEVASGQGEDLTHCVSALLRSFIGTPGTMEPDCRQRQNSWRNSAGFGMHYADPSTIVSDAGSRSRLIQVIDPGRRRRRQFVAARGYVVLLFSAPLDATAR